MLIWRRKGDARRADGTMLIPAGLDMRGSRCLRPRLARSRLRSGRRCDAPARCPGFPERQMWFRETKGDVAIFLTVPPERSEQNVVIFVIRSFRSLVCLGVRCH